MGRYFETDCLSHFEIGGTTSGIIATDGYRRDLHLFHYVAPFLHPRDSYRQRSHVTSVYDTFQVRDGFADEDPLPVEDVPSDFGETILVRMPSAQGISAERTPNSEGPGNSAGAIGVVGSRFADCRRPEVTPVAPAMPCKIIKSNKNCGSGASNKVKSKLACILEASESTRLRMGESFPTHHQDHIAGKGENSLQHYN